MEMMEKVGVIKNIILVNGLPRAGKDTLADYLVEKYGFTKMSFAEDMKNILCRTFNITREELDYFKNENIELLYENNLKCINFRELLQRFATEGMKPVFGNSVWADILYNKIKNSEHINIVVPDFRFLCEYQNHDNLNIKTILVKDDRKLPLEGHASDVELYQNNFKFDHFLYNDKTDNFFKEIEKLRDLVCK